MKLPGESGKGATAAAVATCAWAPRRRRRAAHGRHLLRQRHWAAEWKTAGDTEGWQQGARPGWLVDRRRLGVSWWFLAVAGSWGSALGHESDPPWPFEQPRCNPPRVENSHGPVDLAGVTDLSAGRSFAGARRYGADQVISLDGLLQWWSPLFLSRRPDHLPHTCPISPSRASGYLQMFTLDTVCLLLSWVSDCVCR